MGKMERINSNYIERQYTNAIKGFALILMFVHHFFCFPDRLVDGIEYSNIDSFAYIFHDITNVCVCLFAFLTGYFYYFTKKKTFKYSVRKASDIYINYLFVLVLFLVLDVFLNCYKITAKGLLLELLILDKPNMEFCWYVLFYIMTIFILPLFDRIAKKSSVFAFSLGIVMPLLVVYFVNIIKESTNIGSLDLLFDAIKFISWFPCVASGYVFAKDGLFYKLDVMKNKKTFSKIALSILFVIIPMLARCANESFDFVYAPLIICGLLNLLRFIKSEKVLFPISIIGKYSLLMWFLHSVFFNVSKEYTQPALFYPRNPLLVLLWGLVLTLAVSFVISFPINAMNKIKNKLLKL